MNKINDATKHGYKEYRDVFRERMLGKINAKKPWMKYREIEIIEQILRNLKPKKCLEWGSGYSTLYFPSLLDNNAKWASIEHEEKWFEKIKARNENRNVEMYLIRPDNYPWTDEYGDGDYSDLRNYVEFPTKFGNFDFILVDGRARIHCLRKAYELLSNEGVVILHDAGRSYYHQPFGLFKHFLLFTDYRKEGGIWVGSKTLDFEHLIDVKKHLNRWKIISKIGKVIGIGNIL